MSELFIEVGSMMRPLEPTDEALGLLIKRWLFPLLIWNVPALRPLYQHEWDYILFLLGDLGYGDLIEWALDEEERAKKELEKELGIVPLQQNKLNPNYQFDVMGEPPFTFYELKERL